MNEITRIHIAKTAYDIEVAAKKQLEKYIKSLETYTQDAEVLEDVEIRITELLAECGVKANGVIGSADVDAVRKQLGEPYEFADDEGDVAVGTNAEQTSRRLYRSTDDAVLGGVLSGVATFFGINPLWIRVAFIVLLFVSFGTAALIYLLFWIIIPPARTATEKLQLAGKDVTLESIKELSSADDTVQPNRIAPVLQQFLFVSLGILSLIASVAVLVTTIWITVAALTVNPEFADITNGFAGLGDGNSWVVWLVFWIVMFGFLLLSSLFAIIAYAFFTKKLNKRLFISCVVIVMLGLVSAASAVGISVTQSWRAANESRSMVIDTKANLPKEFANVTTATFDIVSKKTDSRRPDFFGNNAAIRYIVDEGPMRYELSALPNVKPLITVEGTNAKVTLVVPESYRNSFVQPLLVVYGPALESITNRANDMQYTGQSQDSFTIKAEGKSSTSVIGTFGAITVVGAGSVDLGSSSVQALTVQSEQGLRVTAGTVRDLTVTQPDVCPAGSVDYETGVRVEGVTSGQITHNGNVVTAESIKTSCAVVTIDPQVEDLDEV